MRKGLSPQDLGDLFELPRVAVLATYRRDGSVLLSPVWHEWRDNGFTIVVYEGDVKLKHLRRDPRVSIVVCDDGPPYRGIEVRTQARMADADGRAILSRMATRYLGATDDRRYAEAVDGNVVVVRIEPGEIRAWDIADDFG